MNLVFNPITSADISFVNTIRNIYAADFLHDGRVFSLFEAHQWYYKTNPNFWIIFENKERIGYFRLSNYSKENKNIYIGADIAPEYKGKGYAKFAYKKFIPFVFQKYNLNKISLEVLETNKVAISLYEKLGFMHEGTKRQEVYKKDKYIDSIIMSILKKEYYANILENT
jgi:RimJ/RimL family protein N-acetyltransferase